MRRLLVAAAMAAALVAAPALGKVTNDPAQHPRYEAVLTKYIRLHSKVRHKLGPQAAGRNLAIDGYNGRDGVRIASRAELGESMSRLAAMLHPPPPPETSFVGVEETSTAEVGELPPEYISECESGGSYTAVNPTTQAGGRWQIIPSTWQEYGGATANASEASPEEQDRIASEIWADSGTSAWSCG